MIEVTLHDDSLLQLNMLLWMSLPGREEWINPFFYKNGFEIEAIEPELSLPPKLIDFLNKNDLNFERNPRPELVMVNKKERIFLLIECKNQGFDFENNETRQFGQAVSFLCYNASILAEDFGLDGEWEGNLGYIFVNSDFIEDFYQSYLNVKNELLDKGLNDSNYIGTLYWKNSKGTLYLVESENEWKDIKFPDRIKVISGSKNDKEEKEFPLYLIPIDHNLPRDNLGYTVFYKRLKNQLLMFLGKSLSTEKDTILSLEEVLKKAVPVWHLWNNSDNKMFIRNKTRKYLKYLLNIIMENTELEYSSIPDGINFPALEYEELQEIKDYILTADIRKDVFNKDFKQMSIYD